MNWWFYALLIIVVIVALILLFSPQTFYPIDTANKTAVLKLNSASSAFNSNDAIQFLGGSTAIFQGFFYVVPLVRTPTAISCGTPGNPSCEDGRFETCNCRTSRDCSPCKRNGYFPLINISNICSLEIMTAPDAGRQGKALAHLAVQTETNVDSSGVPVDASGNPTDASGYRLLGSGLSQNYIEFIVLPDIPLQKWVMVTILREGRRIDVYYNDTLVVSKKTTYFITMPEDRQPVLIGNQNIGGYATLMKCTSEYITAQEVQQTYSKLADTRGAPYVNIPDEGVVAGGTTVGGAFKLPTFSMPQIPTGLGVKLPSICPSGSCTAVPDIRPAKPWLEWDTDYA